MPMVHMNVTIHKNQEDTQYERVIRKNNSNHLDLSTLKIL